MRRQFDAAFKVEAVRRLEERQAVNVRLATVARDLNLRPEQLRKWAKQLAAERGSPVTAVFPGEGRITSEAAEIRRLQREVETLRMERDFLKKASGVLREGVAMSDKYAVIAAHRTEYPITLMCRVLSVSRAGFYAAQDRAPSARTTADATLLATITDTFTTCRRRYGAPRMHRALRMAGHCVGRKRVARLMRAAGLRARRRRRFAITTDSAHALPLADNVVARDFAVGGPVNTVWVSDTTYLPTREGWLYLAVIIDLASRFVVGWATSARNDTALVLAALQRATALRRPVAGAVHHADRGSTYASHDYRAALTRAGMTASMSRKGNCWDNAVAESFFATLEWELLADGAYATRAMATRALVPFIEDWYNRTRLHSALGYASPHAFEQDLTRRRRAA
ncbi:MAG: IS3 family transposase [Gemmatimonadaceae bacterium]|nr:IS3 family transposase [Gemmatimonadaceae bacterium]